MKFDDHKIHLVYGEKGSGKTTFTAYIAKKISNKVDIYSNYPLTGAYKIDLEDMKRFTLPRGSVIIIDEAAGILNCRDWRNTGTMLLKVLQLIRHMECTLYFISQSVAAIDIQVKDLCDDAIFCERFFIGFSRYTFFRKSIKKNGHVDFVATNKVFFVYRKKYYDLFDTHYLSEEMKARKEIRKVTW